uniref:peptidoglycan editing factor PgeF n=1 Tax=Ningiella ruwaisensis TaxID=2364274 RepID=UPI00109F2D12|nr:peptidoglycan editing factor PgeF [Ningiella ruwaisensis]
MNKFIFPANPIAPRVLCFTTTKRPGASAGDFAENNLAEHVGDDAQAVAKNRHSLNLDLAELLNSSPEDKNHISPKEIAYLNQVHSNKVADFSQDNWADEDYDGCYSKLLCQPIAVMTADCLPVVLASLTSSEYAVVHAGWKGLKNGILQNALNKFKAHPEEISAWIGPSICQTHFEVNEEVAKQFSAYADAISFNAQTQKYHIDLNEIAKSQLANMGLHLISLSGVCTYCDPRLYSYRQATHQKLQQISAGASKNNVDQGLVACGRVATVVLRY